MRAILLFLIGLTFGAAGGFLAAGGLPPAPHDHAGHSDPAHDHSNLEDWQGPPPALSMNVTRQPGDVGANLQLLTSGFVWAGDRVDTETLPGMGHAHIYVDGVKILRAYGEWTHLPSVPAGATIRAVLSTNDHSIWAINGAPIAVEATAP